MDLRKKKLTIEAHPLHVQDTQYFLENMLTIEAHDTNRYPTVSTINNVYPKLIASHPPETMV